MMRSIIAKLIPASGYQNATTSPSAASPLVSWQHRVHRIPGPNVRDDRETPLSGRARDTNRDIAASTRPSSQFRKIRNGLSGTHIFSFSDIRSMQKPDYPLADDRPPCFDVL